MAQTVKSLPAVQETGFDPWVGKIPWRRKMQTTSVFLPGKSHGRRSLAVYSPWGRKKSDMTERLHFHSAYKLNKQSDNIHPWCAPFPILNQPVLSKTIWTIFHQHFLTSCLCYSLVILATFQTFSLWSYCYNDLWSGVFAVAISEGSDDD